MRESENEKEITIHLQQERKRKMRERKRESESCYLHLQWSFRGLVTSSTLSLTRDIFADSYPNRSKEKFFGEGETDA